MLHDDEIALKDIYIKLSSQIDIAYIEESTIYDVINIIANSNAFIGTSLHGCITALSDGKINLALDERVHKSKQVLLEFFPKYNLHVSDYKDLSKTYLSLKEKNVELEEYISLQVREIKNRIYSNFSKVFSSIKGGN